MKLSKKILLSTLGLGAIAVTVPVVLTSCSSDKESKIDFIDLSKYEALEAAGQKVYTFSSDTVNSDLQGKSFDEFKSFLGLNGTVGETISKDSFDKLIKDLTFINNRDKELLWSDIKTDALNNENVKGVVTMIDNTSNVNSIQIVFALKEGATWSDGSNSGITFSVTDMSSLNPGA